jgi:hypothetical protein
MRKGTHVRVVFCVGVTYVGQTIVCCSNNSGLLYGYLFTGLCKKHGSHGWGMFITDHRSGLCVGCARSRCCGFVTPVVPAVVAAAILAVLTLIDVVFVAVTLAVVKWSPCGILQWPS